MELTQSRVRELFDYLEDGVLVRKTYQHGGRKAGTAVGCLHSTGYLLVRIDHKLHKVHRVVFLWHHGYLPPVLDHIDGDKLNNRIENLRPATRSQNAFNKPKQANNTSGFKGVYFHKQSGKWAAEIKANRRKRFLGLFDSPEAAYSAYREAAQDCHGEFSGV